MFSTTPLLSCHIKSAVQHKNFVEIMVQTEHLKFQVIVQGPIFLAVDSHVGRMVSTEDPMFLALNHFLVKNSPTIKELMA